MNTISSSFAIKLCFVLSMLNVKTYIALNLAKCYLFLADDRGRVTGYCFRFLRLIPNYLIRTSRTFEIDQFKKEFQLFP